jgi:hypothetical protein
VVAIIAGTVAFMVARSHRQSASDEVLLDTLPELAWLRSELKLSDEQFAKASELHAAYRPVCVEMCRRISEAHDRLDTLARGGHGITPELADAINHHAMVHAECRRRMLEHIYQTAGLLDGARAERYLETMIPHALDAPQAGGAHGAGGH